MASANPSNSTIAHTQTSIDADSLGLKEVWTVHYCRSAWWIAQIALLGHFDTLMRRYVTAVVELRGKELVEAPQLRCESHIQLSTCP
jgi:hypothetical protein